jgi:hypothetical protein
VLFAGLVACGSNKYLPPDARESTAESAGGLADINRKSGASKGNAGDAQTPAGKGNIVLLVAHDATGRPVFVQTRVSSGDPALDKRAQDMVLKTWRFPRGAPNTELVTVKAKDVPKK